MVVLKAVILAGGFGTRLRPILGDRPKPMAPVLGRPFLEYVICLLRRQGVDEIVLCLHFLDNQITEYFNDGSRFGVNIEYSIEDKPLGTAGAIKKAEKYLGDFFYILNGDTYLDIDLTKMLLFHKKNENSATIALVKMKNSKRSGVVGISEDWRITGFSEKLSVVEGYINAGVYIFEKRILDHIPKNEKVSLEKEILPNLLSEERIFGFLTRSYFIDIGVPKDYFRFQMDVARGVLG